MLPVLAAVIGLSRGQDTLTTLKETGPTSLIIQYRCLPARRAQLRQVMEAAGVKQFEEWKTRGILDSYRLLFSRYVDTDTWDMLALVQFRRYEDVSRWRGVESRSPAGLPHEVLDSLTAVETYPADLVWSQASETAAPHPVYLVVPYTYSVATPAYVKYFDDYVRPQLDGWMREGVLSGASLYLQRYGAARPWDSFLVLQYRDDGSLGLRESVVAKVRQRLQSNPTWKALADSKQNIRVEKEAVIADDLAH